MENFRVYFLASASAVLFVLAAAVKFLLSWPWGAFVSATCFDVDRQGNTNEASSPVRTDIKRKLVMRK